MFYKRRISLLRLRFCLVIYVLVNSLRKIRTLLNLLASETSKFRKKISCSVFEIS